MAYNGGLLGCASLYKFERLLRIETCLGKLADKISSVSIG